MKTINKFFYPVLAAGILACVWSCVEEGANEDGQKPASLTVDAQKTYTIPAVSPEEITFTVRSENAPWEIRTGHSDWSTIDPVSGDAGTDYTVTVQYNDNDGLGNRTDVLTVVCGDLPGERISVTQAGTAVLEVDNPSPEFEIKGGTMKLNVTANQPWSTEITSGSDWLTIEEGIIGENDGTISLAAVPNNGVERTAILSVRDRNGVEAVAVSVLQKGLSLDLSTETLNGGYGEGQTSLEVSTEIQWAVRKGSIGDIWYSLSINGKPAESETGETVSCTGNGKVTIDYGANVGSVAREATFVIYAVLPEGATPVEKTVTIVQAANPDAGTPERHYFNEENSAWQTGKGAPVINEDGSVTFLNGDRLIIQDMPLGRYTFSIRHTGTAYSEMYFIFSGDSGNNEIRWHMNAGSGYTAVSTTPWNPYTNVAFDPSRANLATCELTEAADGSLAVKWILNGTEFSSLVSTSNMPALHPDNLPAIYIGMQSGEGSVTYEWYEYTPLE